MMSAPTPTKTHTHTHTPTNTHSRRVPLDKRKRTETSCDKCKSRKQKCRKEPGQDSCRYCLAHDIECQTTQPRKKRLYGSVEGLSSRMALLESLVKGLLPEADVSNLDDMRQLGLSLGIPLPDSANGELDAEQLDGSGTEGDESLSLLPDQQGQVQYIGPSSSFSFHVKLRTLCGQGTPRQSVLFGRNAAADQDPIEGDSDPHILSTPGATPGIDNHSPGDQRTPGGETPTLESLISAFFEHINPDFTVLHEASFREAYEAWVVEPSNADPAWLCSLLCVLLLSRRVAHVTFPEEQERMWWRRVQTLLPVVIFTSSIMAVQALLLAAIHLHNTNHRDACWNLTGTAVRIAFAIGLHQDKVNTTQTPLAREFRKRLWWTLYAFEQMQVSSYDRPSAVESAGSKIGCPNDRVIGMATLSPQDYSKWFNRLIVHLGSASRAPKNTRSASGEEAYVGPLSLAAGVLRDLERWVNGLPQHLRLDALEASPPAFHRPLLLLHALYHYTVVVLCRAALLARATTLREGKDSTNTALIAMADACADSGKALSRILLRLEALGKFDSITWWDTWYALAAGSCLVLDMVCDSTKPRDNAVSESRILLSQLSNLAQRHLRNPHIPGTLEKFASIIPELHAMATSISKAPRRAAAEPEPGPSAPVAQSQAPSQSQPPQQHHAQTAPFNPIQSHTNSRGAYMFADNVPGRFYQEDFVAGAPYSNTRFDRHTQMSFMDFTVNNIQDWNWGDLGSLLGHDGVPIVAPGPPHARPGPRP
jgi:hypothetical protein